MSDDPKRSADKSVSNEGAHSPAPDAGEGVDLDASVADLTVGELLRLLRRTQDAATTGVQTESVAAKIVHEVAESDEKARTEWAAAREAVAWVGASPTDVQVCFLQGLIDHPEEAERFLDDPAGYSRESGVLLDPTLVRDIVDTVVFGADLKERLGNRVSAGALRDIASMRQRPNACVMSGATTVAAAAVTAVTSALKSETLGEVARLKGLDTAGIRLPGGRVLKAPRDVAVAVVSATNAVAVYATTAVASSSLVSATDRVRLAALRGPGSARKTPKPKG